MRLVIFIEIICSHLFKGGYPFSLFLLCRYVKAEPLGTKTNVLSRKLSIESKENYNIARCYMGYR